MKIFIGFRYTGEDPAELKQFLSNVQDALKIAGGEIYCSINDEEMFIQEKYGANKIFEHTMPKLQESDILLAILRSKEKSEGMLIEIGYALALGKKFILAIHKDAASTYLPELASQVIKFENADDLLEKLKKIKF